METITNGLNQEIKKGDVILRFMAYGVIPIVVREVRPYKGNNHDIYGVRQAKILGLYVRGHYDRYWDEPTATYKKGNDFKIRVNKSSATNGHCMLKLDSTVELRRYGFDDRLIQETQNQVYKVLNGDYDKKPKKVKTNVVKA